MKTITEYLDRVKEKAGIKNDYNLGKELNLTPGAMFEFRHGKSIPSDETCIKLARLIKENPKEIILIAHAARAKSPEAKKVWNGILKKAIGYSIIIILFTYTAPSTANTGDTLYLMRQIAFGRLICLCSVLIRKSSTAVRAVAPLSLTFSVAGRTM